MDHSEVGFMGFFGRTSSGCAPYDHSYVAYRWFRGLILPSWGLLLGQISPFLVDEPLKLSLFYKSLNLLFQIIAIGCVMPVITVETTILVLWPLTGIFL